MLRYNIKHKCMKVAFIVFMCSMSICILFLLIVTLASSLSPFQKVAGDPWPSPTPSTISHPVSFVFQSND